MAVKECACLDERGRSDASLTGTTITIVPDTQTAIVYDLAPQPAQLCRPFLSDEEVGLVASFPEARANAFATGRFCARAVIAQLLGCAPWCPSITAEPDNQPRVGAPACKRFVNAGWTVIGVSFSYTKNRLLVAVAPGRNAGVDIEHIAPTDRSRSRDLEAIAETVFSADQRRALDRAEPGRRNDLFHKFWTRHEASVKATGEGLVIPAEPRGSAHNDSVVVDLELGDCYRGAVVTTNPPCAVRLVAGPVPEKPPGT